MSATRPEQLYESDFYAWTQAQARELRRFARTRPIRKRVEDNTPWDEFARQVSEQILQHFLLIEHSPAVEQSTHWMDEVDEFRTRMKRKLSPTLRRHLKRELPELYGAGRRIVARKMHRHGEVQAAASLPAECPYSIEQVLGDWLPDEGRLNPA